MRKENNFVLYGEGNVVLKELREEKYDLPAAIKEAKKLKAIKIMKYTTGSTSALLTVWAKPRDV